MNYEEVAKRLGMDGEFIAQIKVVSRSTIDFCKRFREIPLEDFVKEVKQEAGALQVDDRTLLGGIYLQLAAIAYAAYQKQGIDEAVYWDTMSDLRIWAENCHKAYKVWGIAEYGWLQHHVKLELFRLGRLQFQPMILEEPIISSKGGVEQGTCVLNVHIPQGEPLKDEACQAAYRQAQVFFKDEAIKFVCHSWLLNPVYQALLPAESNIVKFQNTYEIYEMDGESRQAEERIFGCLKDDPGAYLAETTLQKIAVKHLEEGKKLGAAKGIIYEIK